MNKIKTDDASKDFKEEEFDTCQSYRLEDSYPDDNNKAIIRASGTCIKAEERIQYILFTMDLIKVLLLKSLI